MGEVATGSDYKTWAVARTESYCREGIKKLTAAHPLVLSDDPLETGRWKNVSWHFALNQIVRAQDCEASLHVVQRIPPEGKKSSFRLVPMRFLPSNKLSSSDKMMAAFDALVLSKSLGIKASMAKIIHGNKWSVFTVRVNTLSRMTFDLRQYSGHWCNMGGPQVVRLEALSRFRKEVKAV